VIMADIKWKIFPVAQNVRERDDEGGTMKFRKKPVIVEASRWFKSGDNPAVTEWQGYVEDRSCPDCNTLLSRHGSIRTLEGRHIVCCGDWIITGIKGEFYPCKPDIFEATYERVEG